jgi:hypothetical protein
LEVRWYEADTEREGDYTFVYGKSNENHKSGTGFFVQQRIVSVVKRTEFISDRMSYIALRGLWCNIIVANMHAQTEEKNDDWKDSFYDELHQVFNHFPKCHVKVLLGDFNTKLGREDILKLTIWNERLHQDSNDNDVRVTVKEKPTK